MTKSVWLEIIKQHTVPIKDQDHEFVVTTHGNKEGYIEVFLEGAQHIDYGGGGSNQFLAQRIRIDSDDFLILYHHKEWSDGERDTISYILWKDIRNIKFYWKGRK